ncbi:MAG: ribosomal RNA small subunit methyltransferase A [Bacteroidia bacterium]|nr:ribosomal RNA small subunit methyltransferase A [Bacteroidia bacterium]NNJ56566.1 ribosomal RNA small subunit methyltransferase A [Bacteroidia bacterium]
MKAKKHFGQHFLTSDETARTIVNALGDLTSKDVLEIGPGMGIITQFMVHNCKSFQAVEIDLEAVEYLEKKFKDIQLIKADFLKVDLTQYFTTPFSLIGNFPYNISSQIVFKIIEHSDLITNWVGMFQLEMGIRLVAQPKDKKDYGILSVLIPFYYKIETVMKLPPGAFNPPPKVNSIVVKAERSEHKPKCDMVLLKRVVKTAFGQRRKTLSNSLSSILPKDIINTHQFATLRPENLSYLQFEELSLFIEQHVSN